MLHTTSLTGVILDEEKGAQIHISSTKKNQINKTHRSCPNQSSFGLAINSEKIGMYSPELSKFSQQKVRMNQLTQAALTLQLATFSKSTEQTRDNIIQFSPGHMQVVAT